jgi:phosphoglycerate dehydrogenase-like enzyme
MIRNLFTLGRTGDKKFQTTPGFEDVHVGVVGLGHIGIKVAELFAGAGCKVTYWSKSDKKTIFSYQELNDLLTSADIVLVCVSSKAGENFVGKDFLRRLKNNAVITVLTESVLDEGALLKELEKGRIRAYLDWSPKQVGYKKLSVEAFYCSNESTAYNTAAANKAASDTATQSIINILKRGEDKYRVL